MLERTVRYVDSGDGQVAYTSFGSGPLDLLYVDDWAWHIDAMFDDPDTVAYAERLASFSRVVMFNRRGIGLSDPLPLEKITTIDDGLDDVLAVLDAVGLDRPAVMGVGSGVALAAVLAATRPERVRALVLAEDTSSLAWGDDRAFSDAAFAEFVDVLESGWGEGVMAAAMSPSRSNDPTYVAWVARLERLTGSPRTAAAMWRATHATDLAEVLPLVRAPTLVIHLLSYALRDSHLAELIAGARYVEVPGEPDWPGTDHGRVADEVEEFLTGVRPSREHERVLATVVFTDIVDSTAYAASIGDADWRVALDRHDQLVRESADRYGGRIVKLTGDGLLATFDGPARAVRFALAMRDGVTRLGLRQRAGVHTGEVEIRGDDIGGLGVHIAARISALAGPGDVLTSRTVKDLTAGSGIVYTDRGVHALKGVPDEWQILAATGG